MGEGAKGLAGLADRAIGGRQTPQEPQKPAPAAPVAPGDDGAQHAQHGRHCCYYLLILDFHDGRTTGWSARKTNKCLNVWNALHGFIALLPPCLNAPMLQCVRCINAFNASMGHN